MNSNNLKSVYLNRIAAFLPNDPVSNADMETVLGKAGGIPSRVKNMILRSNAIRSRHYAINPATGLPTHNSAQLAAEAVKILLSQGILPENIGTLSCATSYPDQTMPGHGVMVHGLLPELGMCEVFSAAGVCAAGMAALKHAYHAVRTGEQHGAVAAASEAASAMMRADMFKSEIEAKSLTEVRPEIGFEKDFLRWMLSDGAGAVYLADQPNSDGISFKIRWIELLSYAHEMPPCMYAGAEFSDGEFTSWKDFSENERRDKSVMAVKQDVKLLNENIVRYTVEKPLVHIAAKHGLTAQDIKWFLPHYSSGFFRDKLSAGLDSIGFAIPREKWFTNLPYKGNTGSASIYIILEEFMRTHEPDNGDLVLCYVPESGRFSTCFMLLETVKAV